MKWLFLILLSCCSTAALAQDESHCFKAIRKHINEAIKHNKIVSRRYAKLSDGESKRLSYTLINLERISKLLIINIDNESKIYQEAGIPLLCDELADMKDTPKFQERLPEELRPVDFFQYDYKKLSKNLKQLMKEDLLDEAYQALANDLHRLEAHPYQQCMTRHFLESIARTIKLADHHRNEAKKLGLPDPLRLIKKFITLQRRGLMLTNYMDTQAFPLQKDGLMIYCQDVPAIAWN